MAWDGLNKRLCWWAGRFQGTGDSRFGYVEWKHKKPLVTDSWLPAFTNSIYSAYQSTNVQGCEFDSSGYLWVYAFDEKTRGFRWLRQDGRASLACSAGHPSWQPLP